LSLLAGLYSTTIFARKLHFLTSSGFFIYSRTGTVCAKTLPEADVPKWDFLLEIVSGVVFAENIKLEKQQSTRTSDGYVK